MNLYHFLVVLIIININCQYIEPINLDNLYEIVNSTYMNDVISNITSLIEGYTYLDIAKNPPNSLHQKINLIEELKNIDRTTDKPFYDFYRDVKRVLATTKDIHLMSIPNFNNASKYMACIPFTFNIKKDENNDYQLYMKENALCPFIYSEETINQFINNATENNLIISSINDKDPFDFIQNFGKEFLDLKSNHSRFTAVMKYISNFPLYIIPLNETELTLNIKLLNGTEQNITYFFFVLPDSLQNSLKLEMNNIEWNYTTNGFKCRVDEKNKYNIFYQNTFIFYPYQNIKEIIYNCSKLFHENNYKIIGIESRNEGGMGTIGIYLEQLLQPKICTNKMLFSIRKNDFLKDNFDLFKKNYLDYKTCKEPESIDKFFLENSDYYGNITHNRTIVLDEISLDMKLDLHKKRIELLKTNNARKPTDIIIFTDYHSFSATSIFLKSFQQSGGAIIVGYYGNPKDNETIKDSSVSSSGIINYEWTKFAHNLDNNLQFHLQLTGQEFFDYDYQKENPIPQEYKTIPVDEHVDIYEDYSDDIYDKFINASKIIFDKYNNKCNKNNKLLLLEDNECYNITNEIHAHGGFVCGDNGEWNRTKCQVFYCDIGYYYDTYQKKCIEDLCTKEKKEEKEEDEDNNKSDNNNKNNDEDESPFYAITIIVGLGILVLIIALILIRRTINIKKSKDIFEQTEEVKLMD